MVPGHRHRGAQKTGNLRPLEEIRRRMETRDGASGTLVAPLPAANTETWEETKEKFLNITPDELR